MVRRNKTKSRKEIQITRSVASDLSILFALNTGKMLLKVIMIKTHTDTPLNWIWKCPNNEVEESTRH